MHWRCISVVACTFFTCVAAWSADQGIEKRSLDQTVSGSARAPITVAPEGRKEIESAIQSKAERAEPQSRGTNELPLIVRIAPLPDALPEEQEQRNARVEKAFEDRWTLWFVGLNALFTFGLFVATAGLWLYTYRLWKTTSQAVIDEGAAIRAASDTAIAARRQADISERGLTLPQQPYVLVTDMSVQTLYDASEPDQFPTQADFGLVTVGPTPALIRFLYKELLIASALDAHPSYGDHWIEPQILRFESNVPWSEHVRLSQGFAIADYSDVKSETKSVFLIGRIIYDDVFGNEHDIGFCGRSTALNGRCVPYGGSAYNYRNLTLARDRPRGFLHDAPKPPEGGARPKDH